LAGLSFADIFFLRCYGRGDFNTKILKILCLGYSNFFIFDVSYCTKAHGIIIIDYFVAYVVEFYYILKN